MDSRLRRGRAPRAGDDEVAEGGEQALSVIVVQPSRADGVHWRGRGATAYENEPEDWRRPLTRRRRPRSAGVRPSTPRLLEDRRSDARDRKCRVISDPGKSRRFARTSWWSGGDSNRWPSRAQWDLEASLRRSMCAGCSRPAFSISIDALASVALFWRRSQASLRWPRHKVDRSPPNWIEDRGQG